MMPRWISDVPPAMAKRRAKTVWNAQRPPSGARDAPRQSWPRGPRRLPAVSAIRTYASLKASFSTEPSGPGGSPRSRRVIERRLVSRSASVSIQHWASACRVTGSFDAGRSPRGRPPGELEQAPGEVVEVRLVPEAGALVHQHRDADLPARVERTEQVIAGAP